MIELIVNFLSEFWEISCKMAPWLLFGFMIAGLLSVVFKPEFVRKHLGHSRVGAIFKASLFGVPLPLCSCGVVPVALSLKKQGAGKGATASFLISTPQTGVDSVLVTWSMLGWVFAGFKVVVAFVAGIAGGALIEYFDRKSVQAENEDIRIDKGEDVFEPENKFLHMFKYGFGTLMDDVALTLLAGLGIAAAIAILVPASWLTGYKGSDLISMLLMLAVGIPLYVCSTASVPIAAALMIKGISPGAALVFLIAGPATNAATLTAMTKILGKRSTAVYLISLVIIALGAGFMLNYISIEIPGSITVSEDHCSDQLFYKISGGILLLLIGISIFKNFLKKIKPGSTTPCSCASNSKIIQLKVSDMNCEQCEKNVVSALNDIAECLNVDACSSSRTITIEYAEIPPDIKQIKAVLRNAGFTPE